MANNVLARVRDDETKQAAIAAQQAGWNLQWSSKGHLKFYNPEGHLVCTAPGTGSDWRGPKNLVSALRQAGLDVKKPMVKAKPVSEPEVPELDLDEYDEWAKEQRSAVIEPTTTETSPSPGDVRRFLREHPGVRFDAQTIAKRTGLDLTQVRNALVQATKRPGFLRVERGIYTYEPITAEIRTSQTAPRVVDSPPVDQSPPPLRVRTTSERLAEVEARARAEGKAQLPEHFETVTTDRQGRLVLRDEHGDIWIAAPVRVDFDG